MKKVYMISLIIGLALLSLLLYSRFIGTKGLNIKEYNVDNAILPTSFHGVKIVHLSDIHYGSTIKIKELKKLVKSVNELKPDIVVLTGDFFDNKDEIKEIREVTSVMNSITSTIGKYIVSGNHDKFQPKYQEFFNNIGFTNLDDTYEIIYNKSNEPIMISGLGTEFENKLSVSDRIKGSLEYINSLEKDMFKILLVHEPDSILEFDYSKYNLVLAGHSHNGQVRIPLIGALKLFLPDGAKKYYLPHYKLDNTDLCISSGIGTSTLKLRFNNHPSFNFYRLTNKSS